MANLNHSWPGTYSSLELNIVTPWVLAVPDSHFLYYDAETESLVPLASVLPQEQEEQPKGIAAVFARIRAFFQKIADWFRDLFRR